MKKFTHFPLIKMVADLRLTEIDTYLYFDLIWEKLNGNECVNLERVLDGIFENKSKQIATLKNILLEENFKEAQVRLAGKGLPTGITVLLHGLPGTGKTETAFQLARESNREIIKVDISQSKSMWFGESEKIVKRIFSNYELYAKECVRKPILLFNALNISDRLSDFIHFEKRRPQGTENLYGLLHAIKNQVQISFTYQKFWEDAITSRLVEPYALKEFKNRWYIIAHDLKDKKVKSFALDRLSALEITNKQFQFPNDFDVTEHFRYCFGIISPNGHSQQEVILSFKPFQGKYIKTLPLHESQVILKDNNEELLVKLTLFVTHDFFMEILSFGDNVKVIQPESLIKDLKSALKGAIELYD